jgi:hypothetical protein
VRCADTFQPAFTPIFRLITARCMSGKHMYSSGKPHQCVLHSKYVQLLDFVRLLQKRKVARQVGIIIILKIKELICGLPPSAA